jgi:hypothetical protein
MGLLNCRGSIIGPISLLRLRKSPRRGIIPLALIWVSGLLARRAIGALGIDKPVETIFIVPIHLMRWGRSILLLSLLLRLGWMSTPPSSLLGL